MGWWREGGSGATRRPLPGLQRPVVHAGHLPIRTQLHTMRWHTPCVFLSTSVTRGTAHFASWREALAAGGASLPRGRLSAPRPDRRALVSYLWSGFTFGFALGYQGPVTPARPRNLLSARSRRSAVTAAVALEVSRGHTAGPFVRPPFRLFHCSPLGAAVKSDGSVRLVLDLSSPRGASVNSGISREEFAVRYTSVDAAVAILRREERVYGESGHPPRLPPLPCAARGLAAPVLHVGRAGIRRPPPPFWGPLFPLHIYSDRGRASLDCRTRSRVHPRPPLSR